MPQTRRNRAWQGFVRYFSRIIAVAVFRFRCHDRPRLPMTGGGLLLSNHQSHLDPILVGLATDRCLNYLARRTLFDFPPLRWLILSMGAIAIDREGTGLGGLKETLKRLKQGEMVLMFPEGTRTPDGEVQPLKAGFVVLAQRTGVPLYPVALDGTFAAWPRQRRLPRPAVVHIQFGEPIAPERVAEMTEEQLTREVEDRIRQCHHQAREARLTSMGEASFSGQVEREESGPRDLD